MPTRHASTVIHVFLLMLIAVSSVYSQDSLINIVQWKQSDGGNNHWYAVLAQEIPFYQAKAKAQQFFRDGQPGYLATITSPQENDFIYNNLLTGTYDRSTLNEYYVGGQFEPESERWLWNTGEPWIYANWGYGEPNNMSFETVVSIWGTGNQNYPFQIPGTWNSATYDDSQGETYRAWSVIEWGSLDMTPPDTILVNVRQWKRGPTGGNGHWYGLIPRPQSYALHVTMADQLIHDGQHGYLATIGSNEEGSFISDAVTFNSSPNTSIDKFYLGHGISDGKALTIRGWWGGVGDVGVQEWVDTTSPLWAVVEWDEGMPHADIDSAYIKVRQWETDDGGNGHWFAVIPKSLGFAKHMNSAANLLHDGEPGFLATIGSPAENQFIFDSLLVGLTSPSLVEQYFIGGILNGNWQWYSHVEPWTYANWSAGEPNNVGTERGLAIYGEVQTDPHRIPGKWNSVYQSDAGSLDRQAWAVIEWFPKAVCGDANSDGLVDVADLLYLSAYYFSYGPAVPRLQTADLNANGTIDLGDIVALAAYLNGFQTELCSRAADNWEFNKGKLIHNVDQKPLDE